MITTNTWYTRNQSGTTEHCQVLKDGDVIGEGKYRWINRPWQRYDFCMALSQALRKAGYADEVISMVQEKNSLWSATEALQEVKR